MARPSTPPPLLMARPLREELFFVGFTKTVIQSLQVLQNSIKQHFFSQEFFIYSYFYLYQAQFHSIQVQMKKLKSQTLGFRTVILDAFSFYYRICKLLVETLKCSTICIKMSCMIHIKKKSFKRKFRLGRGRGGCIYLTRYLNSFFELHN